MAESGADKPKPARRRTTSGGAADAPRARTTKAAGTRPRTTKAAARPKAAASADARRSTSAAAGNGAATASAAQSAKSETNDERGMLCSMVGKLRRASGAEKLCAAKPLSCPRKRLSSISKRVQDLLPV